MEEHDGARAMRRKRDGRLGRRAGRLGRPTENGQVAGITNDLKSWTAWTAFRPSILHNGSYCTFLALGSGNVPLTPDASLRLPLLIKERSRPAVQAVQNSITARVSSKNCSRPRLSNVDHSSGAEDIIRNHGNISAPNLLFDRIRQFRRSCRAGFAIQDLAAGHGGDSQRVQTSPNLARFRRRRHVPCTSRKSAPVSAHRSRRESNDVTITMFGHNRDDGLPHLARPPPDSVPKIDTKGCGESGDGDSRDNGVANLPEQKPAHAQDLTDAVLPANATHVSDLPSRCSGVASPKASAVPVRRELLADARFRPRRPLDRSFGAGTI
jgi:hypothetical protein